MKCLCLIALTLLTVVRTVGADDHGGRPVEATPLRTDGTAVRGVIDPRDDEDFFSFPAQAGRRYGIVLSERTASAVPSVVLFAPDGVTRIDLYARNVYSAGPGDGYIFVAPSTGVYFFRVATWPGDGLLLGCCDAEWAYRVRVEDRTAETDDHADFGAGATVFSPDGMVVSGRIDAASDRDVFRMRLEERSIYRLGVLTTGGRRVRAGLAPATDSYFSFASVDARGAATPLWDEQDFYISGGGGGDQFVTVTNEQDSDPSVYSLRVTLVERLPAGDDHGDDAAHATPVTLGPAGVATVIRGVIDPVATDVDVFALGVVQGRRYVIAASGRQYPAIELHTLAGGPVAAHYDPAPASWDENGSELVATATGAILVGVRDDGCCTAVPGFPYLLRLVDLGPVADDHGESAEGAAIVPPDGAPVTGLYEYAGDHDVFSVRLEGGAQYSIELARGPQGLPSLSLDLLGPGGLRQRARGKSTPDGGSRIDAVVAPGAGGDWYLLVSGYGAPPQGAAAAYTLRVTRVATLQDPGPAPCGGAPVLVADGPPTLAFTHAPGQLGWYRFAVVQGRLYEVDLGEGVPRLDSPELVVRAGGCDGPELASYGRTFIAPFTGWAFAGLAARPAALPTACTLAVRDLGPMTDDAPPTGDGAAALAPGQTLAGRLEFSGDSDAYRLRLPRRSIATVTVTPDTENAGLWVYVRRPRPVVDVTFFGDQSVSPRTITWYEPAALTADDTLRISGPAGAGYTIRVSAAFCPGDFDGSGMVDANDVSEFLNAWFADVTGGGTNADRDLDGETAAGDIAAFLSEWYGGVTGEGGC